MRTFGKMVGCFFKKLEKKINVANAVLVISVYGSIYYVFIMPRHCKSAEGLAQWLRSLPPNPEVPSSVPGLVEG